MLLLGNGEDPRRSACRAPFLTRLGQCSVSLRVGVCHPNTRTHVRLLGPCFKTGRANPADGTILGARRPRTRGARRRKGLLDPGPARAAAAPEGRVARRVAGPGPMVPSSGGARPPRKSRLGSLASNDFTYYFTFFPKSFSSFPHGTCSLSVSRKYLALEGHYLPISAAVPSNTTHGWAAWLGPFGRDGALTLSGSLSQQRIAPDALEAAYPGYNAAAERAAAFQFELVPLHSPLLGESRLVSFPRLINMFKFSRSSCLSSALRWCTG